MKELVLVGAVPFGNEISKFKKLIENREEIFLVAIDGGIDTLMELGVKPDYWIGDLDSLKFGKIKEIPNEGNAFAPSEHIEFSKETEKYLEGIPGEKLDVRKDVTDMKHAIDVFYQQGYRHMVMFGGFGGKRVSHQFANLATMLEYAKKGCQIEMVGDGVTIEVIYNSGKTFPASARGNISILAATDVAKGVTIEGLNYNFNGDLTSDYPLGVSNAFIGTKSKIEVVNGALYIIIEEF